MSPKKESPAARSQRLQRVAHALQEKADFQTCCAVLKGNPSAVNSTKKQLVALGMWPTEFGSSEYGQLAPHRAGAPKEDEEPAKTAVKEEEEESKEAGRHCGVPDQCDSGDARHIHRNFALWSNVPGLHIRTILNALEPVTFSLGNLRSMCRKGQREVPKDKLLELFEYMTSIDPSVPVGDDRDTASIIKTLRGVSSSLGRRCRDLQLPPAWNSKGIYSVEHEDGDIVLVKKSSGEKKILTHGDSSIIANYELSTNFSELRATIRDKTSPGQASQCMFYFAPVQLAKLLTPRRKKAKVEQASGVPSAGGDESMSGTSGPGTPRLPPTKEEGNEVPIKTESADAAGGVGDASGNPEPAAAGSVLGLPVPMGGAEAGFAPKGGAEAGFAPPPPAGL